MSIRAFWIISTNFTSNEDWEMLYSRRYSIIEKRARNIFGEKYCSVPRDNHIIVQAILRQMGYDKKTCQVFLKTRDSCDKIAQTPVIEVQIDENITLWPILSMEHFGYLLCCLPLVEDPTLNSSCIKSLLEVDSISTAFSFLLGIKLIMTPISRVTHNTDQFLDKLDKYLSFAIPLGRPGEIDPTLAHTALTKTPSPSEMKQNLTLVPTKNQTGNVKLKEYFRGIQYNNPKIKDVIELYGSITWNGVLEPSYNEVTLNLSASSSTSDLYHLQLVAVHPCVFHVDQDPSISSPATRKLRFKPTLNSFPLCYYTVKVNNFPIYGTYNISCRSNLTLDLFIQLKLDNTVWNNFDNIKVTVPFIHNTIAHFDLRPSWGTTNHSKDSGTIVWTMRDNKFPPHNEISLKGYVTLAIPFATQTEIQRFLSNAFIAVDFDITGYTFSGYFVDPKSIQTSAPTNIKITSQKQFISAEYKLWNENENAPVQYNQKLISELNS